MRGLRVVAAHGALPEEQHRPQPFEVDLDLELATHRASASDDLGDTADYAAAVAAAAAVIGGAPHRLLESLAAEVAEAVLADPAVAVATVTVRKLRPPVPYQLDAVAVRVTRTRRHR